MSEIKYIPIKRIKPNPYRRFDVCPINKEKVEFFKKSIATTNFWCTIVGREVGKNVEIAFGHNRLEALRAIGYKEVGVIIDDICDAHMVKMLAYENSDENGIDPKAAVEALRAARKYLNDPTNPKIADFLGWDLGKVNRLAATLRSIEGGKVVEDVTDLRSEKSISLFRQAVKRTKLPHSEQKVLLDRAIKGNWSGSRLRLEMLKYVATMPEDTKRFKRFMELSGEMKKVLSKFSCPPRNKAHFRAEVKKLTRLLNNVLPDNVAQIKEMMA